MYGIVETNDSGTKKIKKMSSRRGTPRRGGGAQRGGAPNRGRGGAAVPKKDRPPLSYDPFTTAAPVTPITYMSNTKFGYDDFVSQRRYARSMVQGKSDRNFDPDKHKPSEKYLDRLLDAPLGINLADAQQIDEEREAALVTQPPEAMAAFQKDIHNQRVIDLIRGGAPIRSEKPSMELQRRRELADTAAQRSK